MMKLSRLPEIAYPLTLSAMILLLTILFSGSTYSVGSAGTVSKVLTDQANVSMRIDHFLGIPYRDDGALDYSGEPLIDVASGRYTLFADQSRTFDKPGLNCSGFVLAASEKILNQAVTLDGAKKDRKGDSGPNAPWGEDWDFGLDLILNIAEGRDSRVLLPGGRAVDPSTLDGRGSARGEQMEHGGQRKQGVDARGFALQDRKAWAEILPRLRSDKLYLWTLSRTHPNKPLQHHHVGLILTQDAAGLNNEPADDKRKILLYHAARNVGVNKVYLNSKSGLENFLHRYKDVNASNRHIYLLEVDMTSKSLQ